MDANDDVRRTHSETTSKPMRDGEAAQGVARSVSFPGDVKSRDQHPGLEVDGLKAAAGDVATAVGDSCDAAAATVTPAVAPTSSFNSTDVVTRTPSKRSWSFGRSRSGNERSQPQSSSIDQPASIGSMDSVPSASLDQLLPSNATTTEALVIPQPSTAAAAAAVGHYEEVLQVPITLSLPGDSSAPSSAVPSISSQALAEASAGAQVLHPDAGAGTATGAVEQAAALEPTAAAATALQQQQQQQQQHQVQTADAVQPPPPAPAAIAPAAATGTTAAAASTSTRTSSSSSSSRSGSATKGLPLPALIAVGVAAAAAVAGTVLLLLKRRKAAAADGPIDEEDAKFEAELAAIEAEEKRLAEMGDADELSAEEAALAAQQAEAAKKEKVLAAALAEGDAEMARIDAMGSEDLGDLGSEELAALEAELAELQGLDDEE